MTLVREIRNTLAVQTGTYIHGVDDPADLKAFEPLADAVIKTLHHHGGAICENFGHDFTVFVTHNMWSCFRCGEPGWEVPV